MGDAPISGHIESHRYDRRPTLLAAARAQARRRRASPAVINAAAAPKAPIMNAPA
jgi:hypothetical protein